MNRIVRALYGFLIVLGAIGALVSFYYVVLKDLFR
jgi:hypothetical protein